jgi:hypothetical protein
MRKEIHIVFVGHSNEEEKKLARFHDLKNCCGRLD